MSFLVLVIIGGLYAFFRNDALTNKNSVNNTEQTNSQPQTTSDQPLLQTETAGTYDEYSEESFAQAKDQRVLFFYAPWCYQCRELDADLKTQAIPAEFNIFKVDYDGRQDLRQKYGITFRTALVKIDAVGNKIGEEYIAYNEPSLAAVVRDFLHN